MTEPRPPYSSTLPVAPPPPRTFYIYQHVNQGMLAQGVQFPAGTCAVLRMGGPLEIYPNLADVLAAYCERGLASLIFYWEQT